MMARLASQPSAVSRPVEEVVVLTEPQDGMAQGSRHMPVRRWLVRGLAATALLGLATSCWAAGRARSP